MIFKSESAKKTRKIAASLALETIDSKPLKHARIFALEGELGAGKTTFVQGFVKALRIKQKIASPTFVLIKNYPLHTTAYKLLYHIDAFRLRDWHGLASLGIRDVFADPQNLVLIEWAERVKLVLPKKRVWIHIDHMYKNDRKITITGK